MPLELSLYVKYMPIGVVDHFTAPCVSPFALLRFYSKNSGWFYDILAGWPDNIKPWRLVRYEPGTHLDLLSLEVRKVSFLVR